MASIFNLDAKHVEDINVVQCTDGMMYKNVLQLYHFAYLIIIYVIGIFRYAEQQQCLLLLFLLQDLSLLTESIRRNAVCLQTTHHKKVLVI